LRLYPEDFFQLPIIQPPNEEQHRIVESIDSDTAGIRSTISQLEREIDLLREYRTRLVADVVTGKLDVREATVRLPVETAEPTITSLGTDEIADELELNDEETQA
jgi:type I restriction enzyme S subunit